MNKSSSFTAPRNPAFRSPLDCNADFWNRHVRHVPGFQVVLARNFLFALFISVIPALMPVVGLQVLHLNASSLGLLFTSMGAGGSLNEKIMNTKDEENGALAEPLIFTVPAYGFVMALYLDWLGRSCREARSAKAVGARGLSKRPSPIKVSGWLR